MKKSVKVANSKIEGQSELFGEMRDKVWSQPHMTSVVNRFDYDEEEAAALQLNPPLPSSKYVMHYSKYHIYTVLERKWIG